MKKVSLLCIAWLVACSADNTIADPTSQTQRLEDRVQPFCTEICGWLTQCEIEESCACSGDVCDCVGPADPEDCPAECEEFFEGYRTGGETCAQVGMDLMDCIGALSCEAVAEGVGRPCDHIDTNQECGHFVDEPIPTPGPVSGSGGSFSTGGASGAGLVTCSTGFGLGQAGSASGSGGGPTTTCHQGVDDCSDGHGYQVICLAGTSGLSSCTCFMDNLAQGNFQYPQQCPSVSDVNTHCSWNLAQF